MDSIAATNDFNENPVPIPQPRQDFNFTKK